MLVCDGSYTDFWNFYEFTWHFSSGRANFIVQASEFVSFSPAFVQIKLIINRCSELRIIALVPFIIYFHKSNFGLFLLSRQLAGLAIAWADKLLRSWILFAYACTNYRNSDHFSFHFASVTLADFNVRKRSDKSPVERERDHINVAPHVNWFNRGKWPFAGRLHREAPRLWLLCLFKELLVCVCALLVEM